MKSVGGQAAPQWQRQIPDEVAAVLFMVLPVGWVGEWHESPRPQWVVPLSGRWFIETQDGSRVEMGPGDIHWGQDIDTRSVDGGRGHRSGQIGAEPCAMLLVQLKTPHGAGTACPFRRDHNKAKTCAWRCSLPVQIDAEPALLSHQR
jgi:hypothetical protein